jgi:hypothetical protein
MSSYINQYLIEINQYPRYSEPLRQREEWYTIKDYFFYDSNTEEYGHRDTIIPVSEILNKEEIPDLETMRKIINNKDFVIARCMNYHTEEQCWFFDTEKIGESKND